MEPDKNLGADIRITGLGVFTTDAGSPQVSRKVELKRLEIDSIEGKLGGFGYRAAGLALDGLETTLGRHQVRAESVDLTSVQAATDDGNVTLRIGRIGFPRGLMFTSHEELFAPHASIEDAELVIEDLGKLSRKKPESEEACAEPGQPGQRERLDLHFLDVLEGQLNIDLAVDMSLPWIGERCVTHYFRVPIENGTIDYKRLDDDVHWLEAAFLEIDLDRDTLVLARDLPLVPYSGKALLRWPLEPQDIPVAQLHRVHLRNLLRWQVPARKEKSRLVLHSLAIQNIELMLRATQPAQVQLPGGAILQFGDEGQPGLIGLEARGELRYSASGNTGPTALRGQIELVDVTLKDLPLGAASVAVDRLHIGEIDRIELGFEGFRPRRLEVQVSRMAATNLRVKLP